MLLSDSSSDVKLLSTCSYPLILFVQFSSTFSLFPQYPSTHFSSIPDFTLVLTRPSVILQFNKHPALLPPTPPYDFIGSLSFPHFPPHEHIPQLLQTPPSSPCFLIFPTVSFNSTAPPPSPTPSCAHNVSGFKELYKRKTTTKSNLGRTKSPK